MFKRKKPIKSVDLLHEIAKRAEDLSPAEQADSFVAIRRIDGALRSRDSRVIFGRRGTGKTHILSYVAKTARDNGDIACSIDLRLLGSNNSIYSDASSSAQKRATILIRDLMFELSSSLVEAYTNPKSSIKKLDLDKEIENVDNCVRTVFVSESQTTRGKVSSEDAQKVMAGGSLSISPTSASGGAKAEGSETNTDASEWETTSHGTTRLSVNMGEAHQALSDLAVKTDCRIWVLLDEWSSLPEDLQPFLADFIRRALLPIQNVTVQIAAIEYRSQFRLQSEDYRVGLELGSDVSADINLDDYFVYDSSPDAANEFFGQLLFRQLTAFAGDSGLEEQNPKQVIGSLFSQERTFNELARASEGVARDFINILQLASMRSDETKVTMDEVRTAAKDWYERDKQRNLDTYPKAQSLLDWIRDKVIEGKKARAFMLNVSEISKEVEFLFDERVLHIAKRSYSAKDDPGVRYRVWKVDFGCYVDLIHTANNPENFLTEGTGMTEAGEVVVPDDDYRAVRRAILNLDEFEKAYSAK